MKDITKNIIIIPARLQATRFPNKPLADICGVPMIMHVYNQAVKSGVGDVWVAGGDEEIIQCVKRLGGKAIITDSALPSGTDRVYQALTKIGESIDTVINVQGDIPTVDPMVIKTVAQALVHGADITTACAYIKDAHEINNPNVVKAYADFSTSCVATATAFTREAIGEAPFYHHIGLYGYTASSLTKFVSLSPSENEIKHNLEQLRAMDEGMRIDICKVDDVPLGVDTPEDLEKAIAYLS